MQHAARGIIEPEEEPTGLPSTRPQAANSLGALWCRSADQAILSDEWRIFMADRNEQVLTPSALVHAHLYQILPAIRTEAATKSIRRLTSVMSGAKGNRLEVGHSHDLRPNMPEVGGA